MLCGTAVASIGGPVIGTILLEEFGWCSTFRGIAAIWAMATLPLIAIYFYGEIDLNRRTSKQSETAILDPIPQSGVSLGDAAPSATFLKLAVSVLLISTALAGILVHYVPLLTSMGRDAGDAAAIAGIIGLAMIAGRLISGSLIDRVNAALIGAIAFSLPIAAFAILLISATTNSQAISAAALIGLAAGAGLEIAAYLVVRHSGSISV